MRRRIVVSVIVAALGLALLAGGIAYFTVESQALPDFMESTPGATSPQPGIGVAYLALALFAFVIAIFGARRRRSR